MGRLRINHLWDQVFFPAMCDSGNGITIADRDKYEYRGFREPSKPDQLSLLLSSKLLEQIRVHSKDGTVKLDANTASQFLEGFLRMGKHSCLGKYKDVLRLLSVEGGSLLVQEQEHIEAVLINSIRVKKYIDTASENASWTIGKSELERSGVRADDVSVSYLLNKLCISVDCVIEDLDASSREWMSHGLPRANCQNVLCLITILLTAALTEFSFDTELSEKDRSTVDTCIERIRQRIGEYLDSIPGGDTAPPHGNRSTPVRAAAVEQLDEKDESLLRLLAQKIHLENGGDLYDDESVREIFGNLERITICIKQIKQDMWQQYDIRQKIQTIMNDYQQQLEATEELNAIFSR